MLRSRDRILVAANRAFSTNGVGRGCINRIAARAGITKRTPYHHFRSKHGLIAAHLAGRERLATDRLRRRLGTDASLTAERVERLLDEMGVAAADRRWSGCGFLRAAFELAELPGHPGRMVVATHTRCLEARLGDLLARGRRRAGSCWSSTAPSRSSWPARTPGTSRRHANSSG